jgi:hypothetical protein
MSPHATPSHDQYHQILRVEADGYLAERVAFRKQQPGKGDDWYVCAIFSWNVGEELMMILFHANAEDLALDADTFRDFSSFN